MKLIGLIRSLFLHMRRLRRRILFISLISLMSLMGLMWYFSSRPASAAWPLARPLERMLQWSRAWAIRPRGFDDAWAYRQMVAITNSGSTIDDQRTPCLSKDYGNI